MPRPSEAECTCLNASVGKQNNIALTLIKRGFRLEYWGAECIVCIPWPNIGDTTAPTVPTPVSSPLLSLLIAMEELGEVSEAVCSDSNGADAETWMLTCKKLFHKYARESVVTLAFVVPPA